MSKEKISKFTECYNELRSNENLREELSNLSGNKFKTKLIEIFPSVEVTGHFVRIAREILKGINENTSDISISNQHANLVDQNLTDTTDTFKEIASDKDSNSSENNNDTIKEDSITKAIVNTNDIEKITDFNDVKYNLSLTSNNTLNKVNGVLTDKNNIKIIDNMTVTINNFKKEIESKNSEIELLKCQLTSAHEKIKSFSIDNNEKQKKILEIQNNYPLISDNDGFSIIFPPNMIYELKRSYIDSKFIDTESLVKAGVDINTYCAYKSFCESIFNHGTKN